MNKNQLPDMDYFGRVLTNHLRTKLRENPDFIFGTIQEKLAKTRETLLNIENNFFNGSQFGIKVPTTENENLMKDIIVLILSCLEDSV